MDIKKKHIENYKEIVITCQRCGTQILANKYISPYDIYVDAKDELAVFSDGTYRVHKKCLTPDEIKHLKSKEDL